MSIFGSDMDIPVTFGYWIFHPTIYPDTDKNGPNQFRTSKSRGLASVSKQLATALVSPVLVLTHNLPHSCSVSKSGSWECVTVWLSSAISCKSLAWHSCLHVFLNGRRIKFSLKLLNKIRLKITSFGEPFSKVLKSDFTPWGLTLSCLSIIQSLIQDKILSLNPF